MLTSLLQACCETNLHLCFSTESEDNCNDTNLNSCPCHGDPEPKTSKYKIDITPYLSTLFFIVGKQSSTIVIVCHLSEYETKILVVILMDCLLSNWKTNILIVILFDSLLANW